MAPCKFPQIIKVEKSLNKIIIKRSDPTNLACEQSAFNTQYNYNFTLCTALLEELLNFTVPCIDLLLACRSEDSESSFNQVW